MCRLAPNIERFSQEYISGQLTSFESMKVDLVSQKMS